MRISTASAGISCDTYSYDSGALEGWPALGTWDRASLENVMGLSQVGMPPPCTLAAII